MTQLRIGISGWTYAAWRGAFYPTGLSHQRELAYASQRMNSIEINGSFYSLQRPSSYRKWAAETPSDFVFAVKGSRFITHMKKLRDIRPPLANFFASGLLLLGEKLGPILWQFPPQWSYDPARFVAFLKQLPGTPDEASALAEENTLAPERAWTTALHSRPLRYAFEVRHPSFFGNDFIELLRQHNAALVFADTAGTWPYAEDITADFVYIRLHGAEQLYTSGYTDEQLKGWAERIQAWRTGGEPEDSRRIVLGQAAISRQRDVYVYFDNDAKVHAPFDAIRLATRLLS
ncbi:DUF72 domain-containing protein [Pseudanabaena sp. FACHB-2040]|uniref:DUF72 domain-containing protein n=1 Tax=Pseudanabaena sp. FACHB-2040 TaxID=2692859 RepID=UPI001683A4FE|nr:DUF72 domain-containing protein [Pseudanabaena sp. FACHB-2040]MBD0267729.1 DUF72 domain-containing protein [Cyanobacteria bacterium Co-bin8]MBD2259560.1 DUF72 domain-containing protein [Pseudanabaena sp. FACHB-2040]